ncbi:cyclase family protein [Singulisphaera sp. PoT]|uniref:cyclase family protein n=1 Tax=Singulisphaera sp. PoT TaxID=3411797 RepID=UPI003BF595DF
MRREIRVAAMIGAAFIVGKLVTSQAQTQPEASGLADGHASRLLQAKAVDLTYAFDEQTIYWPTDKTFRWEKSHWGDNEKGHWYASATYAASEHGGTHLDAPIHFGKDRQTADQLPISRLIGPAVVVDVSGACTKNRDYLLEQADLLAWEKSHGKIPDGAIVLVHTGWGKFWPDKARYMGSTTPGDTAHLHFPGISEGAAKWLASQRKVSGVGIDTASLDHGPSRDFLAHQVLNGAGIYGLENVASLEKVPASGATLIALPMKIKGGSGGPTRIIAILP